MYYLLGGNKQQLAVYHGQQFDSTATRCGDGGLNRVYMYPFEYLSYGTNDVGMLITRPSGAREYKVVDHLGSTRTVLDSGGTVIGSYDNEPFGAPLAVTGADSRKQYIDKEIDQETNSGNYGVRQYDAEIGRFTSVDALWELFRGQSPYHYCYNSPLVLVDGNGKNPGGGGILAPILGGVVADALASILVAAGITTATSADIKDALRNPLVADESRFVSRANDVDYFLGYGPPLTLDNGLTVTIPIKAGVDEKASWGLFMTLIALSGAGEEPTDPTPMIAVDPHGNALVVPEGGRIVGSPDGKWIQVVGPDGKKTGTRIDGPHNPPAHTDPRSLQPHGHVPGVENEDGTPWLPVKQNNP